ncbi:serine O-acetyltransferase [Streptacidiphilus sp. N1-3]|uniref:Serine O-acetyltransferase n=1 Tax=Streptacidiphilus alkalitolerans TaxID=3342712 RepID=A0ABV6XCB9_9ACTN
MSLVASLIQRRRHPLLRRAVQEALALYGVEVPAAVEIGTGLKVFHRGFGLVMHPWTTIGDDVTLYNGVTIGRADPWVPQQRSLMERIVVEDGAVLCSGAKVLCKQGVLTVGRGTVVGANAVLTRSTGPWEIWAGAPARQVGVRTPALPAPQSPHDHQDAQDRARSTLRATSVARDGGSGRSSGPVT